MQQHDDGPYAERNLLIDCARKAASSLAAAALTVGILSISPAASAATDNQILAPVAVCKAAQETSIILSVTGVETQFATCAHTVSGVLHEKNVTVGPNDYVSAPLDQQLVDGMHVVYRAAERIRLIVDNKHRMVESSSNTVGSLLASQRVAVSRIDEITPTLAAPLHPNETVRVVHVRAWDVIRLRRINPPVLRRADPGLPRGTETTIADGTAGLREVHLRARQPFGHTHPQMIVLGSLVIHPARPKIVAYGTSTLVDFAYDKLSQAVHIAGTALEMIATAYTPGCYGCSGITALGLRAGHGIVAVDPNVIPLGTHLYVPGYGKAVAGDTGGAIRGNRIDLGFNDLSAALRFGRRPITVYVLR